SPGERGSNNTTLAHAERTRVQATVMLFPAGTMYRGTRKHSVVGEVLHAYRTILAQAGNNGDGRRMFLARWRQAIPPLAEAQGLSGPFPVSRQAERFAAAGIASPHRAQRLAFRST